MRFKFYAVLLLLAVTNTSSAANKPIVIDVFGYKSDDYLRVKIQPEIAADSLLGEPLIACRAKWSFQTARIDGEAYPSNYFPAAVLKKVRLYSLQLIFQIKLQAGFKAIACDPGYLDAAGSDEWSFTVTSSPAWDKLIRDDIQNTYTDSLQSQFKPKSVRKPHYLPVDSAKSTFQTSVLQAAPLTGNWVRAVALEKGEVNLWPLRNYLQEKRIADRENKLKKQRKAIQRVEVDDVETLFSDAAFDAQLEQASRTADNQSEIHEMRHVLRNGRDQQERKEEAYHRRLVDARRQAKVCLDTSASNLKNLITQTKSCYEKGDKLKSFEWRARYGYKLDDVTVIEAQYSEVTDFNNGYALVRKNDRLLSITPSGEIYKNLGDVSLESYGYSTQGLILVKQDENYGYINSRGDVVIDFIYTMAESFDQFDRAIVVEGRGADLIDESGTTLAHSPLGFQLVEDLYLSTEESYREEGGCEGDLVSGYKQNYNADGQTVGEPLRFSYRTSTICLQSN